MAGALVSLAATLTDTKVTQSMEERLAEVSFGEWLKRRRSALGLTQEQLAQQINCSTSALRKFESEERRPSADVLEQLAEVFNIPQEERKSFLRFARGDWQAIAEGDDVDIPWRASTVPVDKPEGTSLPKQDLPTGTVTFLFTDIEGSTRLAQQFPDAMPALLARHHEILNQSIQSHNGYVFQVVGDEFAAAFHSARDALNAALSAQHVLQHEAWSPAAIKVRMGIHTGAAQLNDASAPTVYSGYAALAVTQRIMSAAHGGQVLLSNATEALVHGQLPGRVILRDMGEHKFKDVLQPLRVFQVITPDLQQEFPALRALEVFPNNLPAQLTSFVGRSKEIEQIKEHLQQSRLVTLTGSGGIGKTRLALQVASELLPDFPEGVWLLELAPLSDPSLVPQAIANTLGLVEQADRPPLTVLSDFLHDRHILLLLDNCEHLIQACAQLAEALLHACPDLHILATSREALEISGETLYHVPSLVSPDLLNITLDMLPQYEAVQLFVERAQSVLRDFSLTPDNAQAIAQVCHHLDGIPLALELAAARVKVLRAEEIAVRLDDRFHLLTGGARTALPRHQTLRAMIDWSHELLTEPERVLLRRLSVFAGGWTLEAAESACGGEGIEKREILDLLIQLVNKSLILAEPKQGQETRYRMLETIRQYAQEKLWVAGEGELMRQRHLAFFVDLAERAEPNLRAFDMVMWLHRLETEHDNIRVALEWAQESDVEAQLRLAGALWWFWHIRDHKSEGVEWLERALSIEEMERGDQPLTPTHAMIRGKALYVAGFLRLMFWETDKGLAQSEKSLTLFRELGSAGKQGMAYALWNLAVAAGQQSDRLRQKTLHEESLALFKEVGDEFGIAQGLTGIGLVIGDYKRALTLMEEGLALYKEIGDKDGFANTLQSIAYIAFWKGDYKQATTRFESSLALFREVGNKYGVAGGLLGLGETARLQGQFEKATEVLEEALMLARDSGDKFRIPYNLYSLGEIAVAQGGYESAARRYEEGLAIAQKTGNPGPIANGILRLGKVAWAQGNYEQAIKKFDEAMAISQEAGDQFGTVHALYGLGRVAQSQGDPISARALHTEGIILYREKRVLPSWEIVGAAYHLEAFATLAVAQNQIQRSVRLFGAAESLSAGLRFEMSAKERAEHDQAVTVARAALGEEAFAAAWEEGKKMTLDEAVAYALEEG
jgi:predicted ATPase/class 3 adenylate cyclase/DNA-binding XRE family transcriptional regulator/Tfp pilus assembly protein PilF